MVVFDARAAVPVSGRVFRLPAAATLPGKAVPAALAC